MSQQYPPGGNPYSNPYTSPQKWSPPGGGQPLPSGTVKNYLVESIIALLCCGGVFAIPALIYASQVDSKLSAGDLRGARESSDNARKWLIIAVCIAVGCNVLVGGFYIAMIALGAAAS